MDFLDINRLKDLLKIKKAEPENVEGEKTEIKEYYFVSRDRKLFYLSLSNRDKEKKEMIVSGKQIEYKNMVADLFPEKISDIIYGINKAACYSEDVILRQEEVNRVSKELFSELDEMAMENDDCRLIKEQIIDMKENISDMPNFEWVKAPKNGIDEEAYSAINIMKDPKEIQIIINEIKDWNDKHSGLFPVDGMFVTKQTIGKDDVEKISIPEFNKIIESMENE